MSSQSFTQKANSKQSNQPVPAGQSALPSEKKRIASAKPGNGDAQQSNLSKTAAAVAAKPETARSQNKPVAAAATEQNKPVQNKRPQGNRDQGNGHQNKEEQGKVEHDGSKKEATFHFESSSAKSVLLAGDFSEWDKAPIRMIKGGGNVWHAKVALAPGRHAYRFVVDGEWQNDPNRERIPNSFGTFNNVMDV